MEKTERDSLTLTGEIHLMIVGRVWFPVYLFFTGVGKFQQKISLGNVY